MQHPEAAGRKVKQHHSYNSGTSSIQSDMINDAHCLPRPTTPSAKKARAGQLKTKQKRATLMACYSDRQDSTCNKSIGGGALV